jgi:hypothetical protein
LIPRLADAGHAGITARDGASCIPGFRIAVLRG